MRASPSALYSAHVLPPLPIHFAALPVIPSKPRKNHRAVSLSVCLSVELRWRPSSVFLSVLAPFPPTASSFQGNFFRGAAARADADPAGFSWACPASDPPSGRRRGVVAVSIDGLGG